ncbi:TonB-dependent receptor domain-containing protein [Campylobacter sputorum]|uniref:TonB-dependent receptor domain-containing protein n=1 Tax=Campylobacter sputorum TaxID=206 RepID=UPI000B772F7F|nr:TonB-dependent receptor [Campylobacter sputorum]ASM36728.1 TonB-dependent receptor [Campylobacter sputorum bv. faecalis CCUG 20703]
MHKQVNTLYKVALLTIFGCAYGEEIVFDTLDVSANQMPYHGKSNLKSYLKTGSFSYLDNQDITRFRGSSVGDFLSGIPGVMVTNKRNSGAITVNIRGIQNENRVPIYIDGALQSIPSWQGYAGSSTRTYLDPDLISQVEIEKGVSFAGDGVGATGGVVRLSTINYKDVIKDDKDWGLRIRGGTMSNTRKKPPLYQRGGYRTKWVDKCLTNDSGKCKEQTYDTPANYQNGNLFQNLGDSWNGSVAFAKKWENADIVLAYARKYQGNYFAGKHGNNTKISGIEKHKEEDFTVGINKDEVYHYGPYIRYGTYDEDVILGKLKFHENPGYTYFRSGEEVLNTFQENKSYLAKLNLYNDYHAFNISYLGYRSKFGELMPSQTSIRSDGALQGEGNEVEVDTFSSAYKYNPNEYINLKLNTYYTKNDTSFFMPFVEDQIELNESSFHTSHDSRYAYFIISHQKGIGLENTTNLILFDRPLSLNYGVSYSYEKFTQPKDKDDRIKAKNYPANSSGPLFERHAKRDEKSAFLWANYEITDKLIADTGLRYINTTIKDYMPLVKQEQKLVIHPTPHIETRYINIYTPELKNNAISPAFMLTYKPIDEISFYIKYAQAVRNPSLFQASKGWSQQNYSDGGFVKLKPERQHNFEIGTNLLFENLYGFNNVFGVKFAFFNNYTKDYLTRTNILKSDFQQTTNIKSALFRGLESSLYFDTGGFYTNLGLTRYLDTKFCKSGTSLKDGDKECFRGGISGSNLANAVPPKTTLFTTIGTRLFNNALDMGARLSYYSKRFVSIFDSSSEVSETYSAQWDSHSIVDLYASYKPNDSLTISAAIDNLTNRYYIDANNMSLSPAPGRTFRLDFEYKF